MNFPDAFSSLLENRGIRRTSWDLHEATWIRVTQHLHPFVQVPRIEIYKKKPLTALHSHIDLKEHPQARAFFKWADAYNWSVKKEFAP